MISTCRPHVRWMTALMFAILASGAARADHADNGDLVGDIRRDHRLQIFHVAFGLGTGGRERGADRTQPVFRIQGRYRLNQSAVAQIEILLNWIAAMRTDDVQSGVRKFMHDEFEGV